MLKTKNKIPYHAYIDPDLNRKVLAFLKEYNAFGGQKLTRSALMEAALKSYLKAVYDAITKDQV